MAVFCTLDYVLSNTSVFNIATAKSLAYVTSDVTYICMPKIKSNTCALYKFKPLCLAMTIVDVIRKHICDLSTTVDPYIFCLTSL